MEVSFKQKLFYFFPVLFCFLLPFGSKVLSIIVTLWVLASFLNIKKRFFLKGVANKNLWLLWSFFFLTVISALASHNKVEASSSIEVKLSFFFFPYLFFCFEWPLEILKRCLISFVSGCFFACLYLIARASVFAYYGEPQYFFYGRFSYFLHTSYFSMYLVLAIAIVAIFYKRWFQNQKNILYSSYFFVVIFAVTVFLCSSKLGIVSLFVLAPLLIINGAKLKLSTKNVALAILIFILIVLLPVKNFPLIAERFYSLNSSKLQHIDKTSSESTTVRVLIWEQANHLIEQNFWVGTGVGDANDALYKAYENNGMTGALNKRLNTHNQFLQTFVGLGFFGFILLLVITVGQMVKALAKRRFLLFLFSLIIVLNFIVESMLQTAAGVLFFAFFFCLLNLMNEKKLYSV